jgi:hypothetical protein
MKATAIYQQPEAVRLNCTEQVNDSSLLTLNSSLSLKRIYRAELRTYRAIARWIDRHPRTVNTLLTIEALAALYIVFMYA